ncbi:hypothetical protein SAMN05421833_12942 [Microbispora rosea]|uniref:CobQ/CobB/MinD/ParA nucleotide binding domain-containing protein n=1 Tax=Microbispora rosea TaxID=58117 RepID=A0A1N7GI69_9ACTN|nr:hypothetical protein [Microbispora rosea]GIH51628.1 hypothetical protein Mro03_68070 [Microbispora rosea subsp. rosea]SIS12219.1 hypothetical protein SAMN05421833_12942 [Microbispora rosea]
MRQYDTVFIDCPGSLEGREILPQIVRASTFVLIPYEHEPESILPTLRTARRVAELGVRYAVVANPQVGADHVLDAWRTLEEQQIPHFQSFVRLYRAWPNSLKAACPSPAGASGTPRRFARMWPVLVSTVTATGTQPVSDYYLSCHLLLQGVQLEQIRGDRILHEALAVETDPLHLAMAFNLSWATAIAYADVARTLLERPIETIEEAPLGAGHRPPA